MGEEEEPLPEDDDPPLRERPWWCSRLAEGGVGAKQASIKCAKGNKDAAGDSGGVCRR